MDYARRTDAVILFDAAYEAFIEEDQIPHSIFEIEGAKECAIEVCSLPRPRALQEHAADIQSFQKNCFAAE